MSAKEIKTYPLYYKLNDEIINLWNNIDVESREKNEFLKIVPKFI